MRIPFLFLLFFCGSILGFFLEGAWCFLRVGRWERHSATLFGPFCVLYGAVAVGGYLLSRRMKKSSAALQLLVCALAGTAVEWIVSGLQLAAFGAMSWDYRHHPFDIAGRVSLPMALLWGILGLAFLRLVCPWLDKWADRLTGRRLALPCAILAVFLAADLAVTGLALGRWSRRQEGLPPQGPVEARLDAAYPDRRMAQLFPNWDFLAQKYPEEVR